MTAPTDRARISSSSLIACALLAAAVVWSYWTTFAGLLWRWAEDSQYSHGYLVPAFACYLLWLRRERLGGQSLSINPLGLALIALAVALRLAGAYYRFEYLDQISLLPCVAGLFVLLGDWRALFWSLPGIAFLAFMVPLPHSVSLAMSGPMQSFATVVSTFMLQALGRPAIAEGNVILLNDIELGIVEACSGLRMLVVFFALSTAVAMLIRKPLWEKIFIAASAVPIALLANVLRITITGLLYDSFGNHLGGALFHDLAGWLMMPLGLAFLGIELWILRRLLIEPVSSTASEAGLPLEVNPVALYRSGQKSRREKLAPEAETVPVS